MDIKELKVKIGTLESVKRGIIEIENKQRAIDLTLRDIQLGKIEKDTTFYLGISLYHEADIRFDLKDESAYGVICKIKEAMTEKLKELKDEAKRLAKEIADD
jgi:hypothetical protein